jgi:hypothetical protein
MLFEIPLGGISNVKHMQLLANLILNSYIQYTNLRVSLQAIFKKGLANVE